MSSFAGAVIGTDQSMSQLKHAMPLRCGGYAQALAERSPFASNSIDVITVAQALHWFDFDAFYNEVARVAKPGAAIAVWTYSFLTVTEQLGPSIDEVIREFYFNVIGPYWPPERRWVDERYETIPFPFEPIAVPAFTINVDWDLAGIVGYIASWSATQRYKDANGKDPVGPLNAALSRIWGAPRRKRALSWPLSVRAGRVSR